MSDVFPGRPLTVCNRGIQIDELQAIDIGKVFVGTRKVDVTGIAAARD